MRSKPDVQRLLDKKRPEGKYVDVTIDQFDFSTQPKVSKAHKEDKPTKTGAGRGGRGGRGMTRRQWRTRSQGRRGW